MTNGNHRRWLANREPAGEHKANRRKVTDEQVRAVRRELLAGRKHQVIADLVGCSISTVHRISTGVSFIFVKDY